MEFNQVRQPKIYVSTNKRCNKFSAVFFQINSNRKAEFGEAYLFLL